MAPRLGPGDTGDGGDTGTGQNGSTPVIPPPDQGGGGTQDTGARARIRAMLASLGVTLPVNLTVEDVDQAAKKLEGLQKKLQQAQADAVPYLTLAGQQDRARADQWNNLQQLSQQVADATKEFIDMAQEVFKGPKDTGEQTHVTREVDSQGRVHITNTHVSKDKDGNTVTTTSQQLLDKQGNVIDPNAPRTVEHRVVDSQGRLHVTKEITQTDEDGNQSTSTEEQLFDKSGRPIDPTQPRTVVHRTIGANGEVRTTTEITRTDAQGNQTTETREGIAPGAPQVQTHKLQHLDEFGRPTGKTDVTTTTTQRDAMGNVSTLEQIQQIAERAATNTQPGVVRGARLPTAQEFMADFNNAYASVLENLGGQGSTGLAPEVAEWARSGEFKDRLHSQYLAALGASGNPFPGVTGGGGGAQTLPQFQGAESAVAAMGAIPTQVGLPGIMPSDFLRQKLTPGIIQEEFEGSRTGAGRRYLLGGDVSAKQAPEQVQTT